jgi:multiple sugar transport system ATP-binding protein
MIYVTHDQVEAMTLADKVVVLNAGQIEQIGSPLELYHNPANLFVAGFLGTPKMGFLKGKVTRADSQGCELELAAGTRISLPRASSSLSLGSEVTLGIRPEHLELAQAGQCQLDVIADVSERLGSDTFCHVVTDSGEPLTLRIRGDMSTPYGERLSLHLNAEHCHLFDAQGVAVASALRAAA